MRRRLVTLAALAALFVLAAMYIGAPSKTPANQTPLLTLSPENFGEFVAAFDRAPDVPRLLLLFSPT